MEPRMEQQNAFAIVGVKERVLTKEAFRVIPAIWAKATERGVLDDLWNIRKDDHPLRGILGICDGGEEGLMEAFDYCVAVVSEQETPDRMCTMTVPEATWAVFESAGPPDNIQQVWTRLPEWLASSSYEMANLPVIERYLPPAEARNELWVPVVAKK